MYEGCGLKLDVVAILDKLAALEYVRLNKVSNGYYQIYCPFHNDGNERKPSCGVLLETQVRNGTTYPAGWFHCFTCGYAEPLHTAVADILKLHSIKSSAIEWLQSNIPGFEIEDQQIEKLVPSNIMSAITSKYALTYIAAQTQSLNSYISESELSQYRFTVPYMYERKLTDDIIAKFDVGVDMNWIPPGRKKKMPCLTFPVQDKSGNVLFIYRRSIEGKFFSMPTNITKPVYGLHQIPDGCSSVVICESILNALTSWRYGRPAVALLGTGTAYQIRQLKESGIPEFVICLDGDDAGARGTAKLKRNLRSCAICWAINMTPGKDLNDLTKDEYDKLYDMRE